VRSYREQKFLYDRYVKGLAQFPAVPPNHSAHEYGWAFDLVVTPYAYQPDAGHAWESEWGGSWGGAKDLVHFELPGAGKLAYALGEQGALGVEEQQTVPTLWDYTNWALDFGSLDSLLFELGYVVSSRKEAEKIARALHVDPNGRVF
jgi:hypothetical protein